MKLPRRRERDESRKLKDMGEALGWINTNSSVPFHRERSNMATYVGENPKPYQQQFHPGEGGVRQGNAEGGEGNSKGTEGIRKKSVKESKKNAEEKD